MVRPSASIACIRYSSWVCTIRSQVAQFANDTLTAYIDVLGVLTTLPCHEVWADIEAEACRTSVASGELGVHIDGFVLGTGLHRALTIGIVPIVRHKAVLIGCKESVLLGPTLLLLGCFLVFLTIALYTAGVDVDKVSVGIVCVRC